jgi:signal transduction histidine kinase
MKKISHKIWIGMMLIVLLLSGTLLAFQHFYLEEYYLESKAQRVKTEILRIAEKQSLADGSTVFDSLDAFAYEMNISIEIVDSDRNSIYVNEQSDTASSSSTASASTASSALVISNWMPDFSVLTASITAAQGTGGSGGGNGNGSGGTAGGDGTSDGNGTSDGDASESATGQGNHNGRGIIEDGESRTDLIDKTFDGDDQRDTSSHPRYGFEVLVLSVLLESDLGEQYVALATIPLSPIDDMIAITSQFLTVASLVLFLVAGILAYYISRQLTRPIRKLTKAAHEIEQGELSTRVDSKSNDEIGELCHSFNNMADTLEKTGNLRTEIVENVSHEMRTPLSIIKGYADLIGEVQAKDPEAAKTQLAIISREADRMDFLLGDILDFAQMQSGMLTIKNDSFDIANLVNNVIDSYQSILKESNMEIVFEQKSGGMVVGDQRRIEQVLHNLIKNAINYSPDEGVVKVTLEDVMADAKSDFKDNLRENAAGYVRIGVTNSGPVIPEDEINLIWDRYYRTKGIKKRNIMGSGLGLSIVKSILEAHQVKYGATSQASYGTTFWFQLKRFQN